MTLEKVLLAVQKFVADRGGAAYDIKPNTALLGDGHIDSFALIELIANLERDLEIRLPDGALIPEDFETVSTLFERIQTVMED